MRKKESSYRLFIPAWMLLLVTISFSSSQSASAQTTRNWIDPFGGNFSSVIDWSPLGVPGPFDTARFALTSTYSVRHSGNRVIGHLLFENSSEVTLLSDPVTSSTAFMLVETLKIDGVTTEFVLRQFRPEHNFTLQASDHSEIYGRLNVQDGAKFVSDTATIGTSEGGSIILNGQSTTGQPSTWLASDVELRLGSVDLLNGGYFGASTFEIERGEVYVRGDGSLLTVDNLKVGQLGLGNAVYVIDGGEVSAGQTVVGSVSSGFGGIYLRNNPTSPASTWINSGDMYIGGTQDLGFSFGTLSLQDNSYVDVGGTIKVWPNGDLTLADDSVLTADVIEDLGGDIDIQSGRLQFNQYEGDLINKGAMIAPGGSNIANALVIGDYSADPGSGLEIDVQGNSPGSNHDLLNVTGQALIDGNLELNLSAGYQPSDGDTWIVFASSSLLGSFDNAPNGSRLETIDGRASFKVNYGIGSQFEEDRVVLSDFESNIVLGDVNGDGVVDLLDVTPFVQTVSAGEFIAAADINQDGVVNLLDVQLFVELLAG